MGIYKLSPPMSGRMAMLRTLAPIAGAALIEYGCMGHMLYGRTFLDRSGVPSACKLYSTHIDETDIAMGDTTRLTRTVAEVIKNDNPSVVFLLPSAIPEVIGTDLKAAVYELQPLYPTVPLIVLGNGGFDVTPALAVEQTLLLLAKALTKPAEKTEKPTYNIVGSCADIFSFLEDSKELARILKGAFGMEPVCILTSGGSVQSIEKMASAHINIVVRREGESAAKHLQKTYGTPYLVLRPYGIEGTTAWLHAIAELLNIEADEMFITSEQEQAQGYMKTVMPYFERTKRFHPEEAALSLGGHADVVKGILDFGYGELGLAKGTCWCDEEKSHTEEIPYMCEAQWITVLENHEEGFLMCSGEALKFAGKNTDMQIAIPDLKWRMHSYGPPLMGFRGAVHLTEFWINAAMENHK